MPTNLESKNIDKLLAEAEDMEEEHRLQFETHAQNLKKIKSEFQAKVGEKGTSDIGSGAEGMHKAILDIVKAMGEFTKYVS